MQMSPRNVKTFCVAVSAVRAVGVEGMEVASRDKAWGYGGTEVANIRGLGGSFSRGKRGSGAFPEGGDSLSSWNGAWRHALGRKRVLTGRKRLDRNLLRLGPGEDSDA